MITRSQRKSGSAFNTPAAGVVPVRREARGAIVVAALFAGCSPPAPQCPRCDTLVIAASGEPDALLPPLVGDAVGRDISDLVYERLARLRPDASPIDSAGYLPALAARWERVDSLTLRFILRSDARWHDGVPLTAADVVFSFEAYADGAVDAQARSVLAGRIAATAPDDSTVLVHFRSPDPEQWYDATWHVRILPRHIWDSLPRAGWAADTGIGHLVGSGPYRVVTWLKGQSLRLERAPNHSGHPAIKAVVWRFAGEQDAALNLLQSHEADLLESIGDSARVARVRSDPALATIEYPSAVYGFLGFNLARGAAPLHVLEVRRALALATDRATAARAVLGPGAVAPSGPMSRILWINDPAIVVTAFDTAAASATLDAAGWRRAGDGVRRKSGRALAVDILVPGTSVARRNLAQVVQEMWRRVGVTATVTSVDFPVFQERLRTGRFESFVGAWLDEPSPRSLADQWTGRGIGVLNYTGYRSTRFDSLFQRAAEYRGDPGSARRAWLEAIDQLNRDVPAIWLYTPMNVAGAAKRVRGIEIDPYSWLSGLPRWTLSPP